MAQTGVAPVEQAHPPVAHEDLGVVQVVVLQRVGQPRGRQLGAQVAQQRHGRQRGRTHVAEVGGEPADEVGVQVGEAG